MDLLGEFQPDIKAKIAADIASKERESIERNKEFLRNRTKLKRKKRKRQKKLLIKKQTKRKITLMKKKTELKVLRKIDLEPKQKEEKILEGKIEKQNIDSSLKISNEDSGVIKANRKAFKTKNYW